MASYLHTLLAHLEAAPHRETLAATAPQDVDASIELLNALTTQANSILGAVLKAPLEPFSVGGAGNFPYYYQMPSTLQFNGLTYNWISYHLLALSSLPASSPATLSVDYFTNLWIEAFSKISFQYSKADQALLNQAMQQSQIQQTALLNGWQQAFGSLPTPVPPVQTITDQIMFIITSTWAVPPTSMYALQQAPNLRAALNNAPASGLVLLPLISNFLQALSSSVSLANQGTMNNGYLSTALANVQTPSTSNGGLTVSGTSVPVPAWTVIIVWFATKLLFWVLNLR